VRSGDIFAGSDALCRESYDESNNIIPQIGSDVNHSLELTFRQ
jgi:hypothetical protein